MNPYYAIGAIFSLGIRGIKKEIQLKEPPFSQLTLEDKAQGKVRYLSVDVFRSGDMNIS